jgi:aspartate ammonia-lyase
MRKETDFIGSLEIPDDALYGIHSLRAASNFPDTTRFHIEWYMATGMVKKACLLTYLKYSKAVKTKYPAIELPLPLIDDEIIALLLDADTEIENGLHFEHFIVPAIQGGAGTSINMNVNEIMTNRALQKSGHKPGDYSTIHPIEHANIFQSTNDVIPTSLRITVLKLLLALETEVNNARSAFEEIEKQSRNHLRIAYTQMQEAVPSTYGRLFSTYCDALSRDWWRISKCSERIKVINLGGSAIGTGITVPRFFMSEVVTVLQQVSGLPVSRGENLHDATCNLDAFVEVHAILKAHAVNLEKTVSDLRLLSSDLFRNRELTIPMKQTGSSVMPGKINPVISEFVISSAHKVYANDQLVASLCGQGCLDLNAYTPVIGHAIIESIKLLIACNRTIKENLVSGIKLSSEDSFDVIAKSPSITTALLPYIGYDKSAQLAREMKKENVSILEANRKFSFLPEEKLLEIIKPQNLLREGFSLDEIIGNG